MSHLSSGLTACALALGLAVAAQAQDGAPPLGLMQVMREAVERYPAVQAAQSQRAAAAADVDRALAARWPVLGFGAAAQHADTTRGLARSATPQASYTLYAGGGIEAGIDRARRLAQAADGKLASTLDEVAFQAGEAYLLWARALQQVGLARQNLQRVDQIRADMATIVEVDRGRMVDLNQARVRVQSASLQVTQREMELEQARLRLGRYVESPLPPQPLGLDDLPPPHAHSLAQAVQEAQDRHPLIAQALAQLEAAREGVSIAQAQLRPKVDLSVARQLNPGSQKGQTVSQLALNMPVFNGGAGQAGVRAAVEQWRAAQGNLEEQRRVLREKIGTAWAEWQMARQRTELSVEQASGGEQLVENYRAQFRLARRSLLDLLNVQNEVYGYQAAAVQAGFDARIAALKLQAAMGRLAPALADGPVAGASR